MDQTIINWIIGLGGTVIGIFIKSMLDSIKALFEVYRTKTDPEERRAIYHQIDSISYEASKIAIPNEYDKLMAVIGADNTNAFTSNDMTVYQEDIPSNEIDNWAKIEADRFMHPVIRGFHTELEAVYEEKNMSLTQDNRKAMEAIDLALRAVLNPGDEVLYHEPCYVSYAPSVNMAYGVATAVPTSKQDMFALNPAVLEASITPRTKVLMLNFPTNPTGAVAPVETLQEIARICIKHDLILRSSQYTDHFFLTFHFSAAGTLAQRCFILCLHRLFFNSSFF